ncbi:hypothetical protein Cgig2_005449 [Carnegiea gigantea]|uniref:3-oxo-5-alpha-steroid 4-dehydrogenase C-terminal domain-containing protein n=1 Tax=Carnegiea gigantea TaxID=171969 RepID=A0A9Q1KDA3_9CARY|nr:hypothetical protein Cgig2_005449 [Carnegiea gigantea]
MEFKGKHVRCSKFFNLPQTNPTPRKQTAIPSKSSIKVLTVREASDREKQSLPKVSYFSFVHKYGNSGIVLEDAIPIALSDAFSTVTMIYAQHLSSKFPKPSIDLKYARAALFLLGIGGNFYHHYILATLRQQGEKVYKIPRGDIVYSFFHCRNGFVLVGEKFLNKAVVKKSENDDLNSL